MERARVHRGWLIRLHQDASPTVEKKAGRVAELVTSYNSHDTRQRLSELDAKKLTPLVPNKDERKTVVSAVKGIAVENLVRWVSSRLVDSEIYAITDT